MQTPDTSALVLLTLVHVAGRRRERTLLVRIPGLRRDQDPRRTPEQQTDDVRDVSIGEHLGEDPERCTITTVGVHWGPAVGPTISEDLTTTGVDVRWAPLAPLAASPGDAGRGSRGPDVVVAQVDSDAELHAVAAALPCGRSICGPVTRAQVLFTAGFSY